MGEKIQIKEKEVSTKTEILLQYLKQIKNIKQPFPFSNTHFKNLIGIQNLYKIFKQKNTLT